MAASDQIRQMVNFILQEAHEKANEIRVKVCRILNQKQNFGGNLRRRGHDDNTTKQQYKRSFGISMKLGEGNRSATSKRSKQQQLLRRQSWPWSSENLSVSGVPALQNLGASARFFIAIFVFLRHSYFCCSNNEDVNTTTFLPHLLSLLLMLPIIKQTEHDFNLEKQTLVHEAKLSIQDVFAKKEKDHEVQERIARSAEIGACRVKKMKIRDALLKTLLSEAGAKCAVVARGANYPQLLQKLIVQCLIKIEDNYYHFNLISVDFLDVSNIMKV